MLKKLIINFYLGSLRFKNNIEMRPGISFALRGWGNTLFLTKPTQWDWVLYRKKFQGFGTAKILVSWFSQYRDLKVQNFAIFNQL
jgi:hypothetical protein